MFIWEKDLLLYTDSEEEILLMVTCPNGGKLLDASCEEYTYPRDEFLNG
jgi:hypothetical protein